MEQEKDSKMKKKKTKECTQKFSGMPLFQPKKQILALETVFTFYLR
jgi:hypothetical protein